jgi:hypothetical protein
VVVLVESGRRVVLIAIVLEIGKEEWFWEGRKDWSY